MHLKNKSNPNKCPISVYKKFMSLRPPSMLDNDSPFFLGVNYSYKLKTSAYWYKAQPMGENTLGGIMKKMCQEANIQGKKTNHSVWNMSCQLEWSPSAPQKNHVVCLDHTATHIVLSFYSTSHKICV